MVGNLDTFVKMKKTVVLFLLCIFLFNNIGYYVAFKVLQCHVKREIKAEIKKGLQLSDLAIITLQQDELATIDWRDNGKEMVYNGELFDIVRRVEDKNAVTFYCINDKQEHELFANLDDHINRHMLGDEPLKNKDAKKIKNQVIKLYYANEMNRNVIISTWVPSSFIYSSIISAVPLEVDAPPPQQV